MVSGTIAGAQSRTMLDRGSIVSSSLPLLYRWPMQCSSPWDADTMRFLGPLQSKASSILGALRGANLLSARWIGFKACRCGLLICAIRLGKSGTIHVASLLKVPTLIFQCLENIVSRGLPRCLGLSGKRSSERPHTAARREQARRTLDRGAVCQCRWALTGSHHSVLARIL